MPDRKVDCYESTLDSMKRLPNPKGLLLAGGSSRRFGRDKLTEPVGGQPLLSRPLSALSEVCEQVFVSVAPGKKASMEAFLVENSLSVNWVLEDEAEEFGPLAGIREGFWALETMKKHRKGEPMGDDFSGIAPLLVLAADLPAVTHRTLTMLIRAYEAVTPDPQRPTVIAARAADGGQATEPAGATEPDCVSGPTQAAEPTRATEPARATGAGRIQPLCAIWMPSVLPLIIAHLEAGERSVFGVLDKVDLTTVDVPSGELININRPSDLELLSQM